MKMMVPGAELAAAVSIQPPVKSYKRADMEIKSTGDSALALGS
jgi:hypothetical protein